MRYCVSYGRENWEPFHQCVKHLHRNPRSRSTHLQHAKLSAIEFSNSHNIVMSSEKEDSSSSKVERKLACSKHFDALWFCYSPVHQMQQYYRLGVLDNCVDKVKAMFDCLMLKTKSTSERQEILEAREKSKKHIWTFRTPEEASYNWKELYGHLDKPE